MNSQTLHDLDKQAQDEDYESLEKYRLGTEAAPTLYRPIGFLKSVDKASGDMTFVANEESEDRMGDIIKVDGWQLGNFKSNPVLMFAHDYRLPPVGIVPRVWKSTAGASGKASSKEGTPQLLNTVKFDDGDPFAVAIMGKYERGFMKAESVGFRPIEFERKNTDDDSWFPPLIFTKQELLEISLVPVPAHPRALRKAWGEDNDFKKFSIVMPAIEVKEEEPVVEEPEEITLETLNEKIDSLLARPTSTSVTVTPSPGVVISSDEDDGDDEGLSSEEQEKLFEAISNLREE